MGEKIFDYIANHRTLVLLLVPAMMVFSYLVVLVNPFNFIELINYKLLERYTPSFFKMISIDRLRAKTSIMIFLVFYHVLFLCLYYLILFYYVLYYKFFIKYRHGDNFIDVMNNNIKRSGFFVFMTWIVSTVMVVGCFFVYNHSIRIHEIRILFLSIGVTGFYPMYIVYTFHLLFVAFLNAKKQ